MKIKVPRSKVIEARDKLLMKIEQAEPDDESYEKMTDLLKALNGALEAEKRNKLSVDTVVILITQVLSLFGVMVFTRSDLLPKETRAWFPRGRL